MRVTGALRQFEIIGRKLPTEKEPVTKLYRMKIFAPNDIVARSRFWYFLSKLRKFKKTSGEVVSCSEIHEKKPKTIKNFGVWARYDSRSYHHNMYKEFRDLTIAGAVTSCYRDMAARHRVRGRSLHIIKAAEIPAAKCRRVAVTQFHDNALKFPLPHRVLKSKAKFLAKRPHTFF
ncbi:ribosomal protein L18ae [Capsaspora owczarzaki ATCC 30864]|uniref:60S ribosomal protein L18a n=1 Tax=Capsaspora owczarzaki (strain ATCC 30864) TaxID=595528 RepID=A0A0D2X0D4_CAPO3|nr:ribosomal protein L18ae [Capsaspora owczarzaki ATCC 30864]KJE88864.1 ribosomal protein L18ae [Capsaspora owczarzaki ATCC 30864]|eukprot:XP_004365311.1 ribosomal protein L18ae [Capsaspora owczarzaki ATCC 30864]